MNASDYTNYRGYVGCTPQPCIYNRVECCTGSTGPTGPIGPAGETLPISGQGTGAILLNSPAGSEVVTYSNLVNVETSPNVIKIGGDLLPAADNVFSLGSLTKRWKDLFIGPSTVKTVFSGTGGVPLMLESSATEGSGNTVNSVLKGTAGNSPTNTGINLASVTDGKSAGLASTTKGDVTLLSNNTVVLTGSETDGVSVDKLTATIVDATTVDATTVNATNLAVTGTSTVDTLVTTTVTTDEIRTGEIHTSQNSIYFDKTTGGDNTFKLSIEGNDTDGYAMISKSATGPYAAIKVLTNTGLTGSIEVNDNTTSQTFGTVWHQIAMPNDWKSVATSADGSIIIAGTVEHVYLSKDSGKTFVIQTNVIGQKVACSADGEVLVATFNSDKTVWVSTDSGTIWNLNSTVLAGSFTTYVAVSPDGQYVVVTIENGSVYISNDHGTTFTTIDVGTKKYTGIAISEIASTIIITMNNDYLYISKDQGATFIQNTTVPETGLKSPSVSADGIKMLFAENSNIYKSIDSGITWDIVTSLPNNNYNVTSMSSTGEFMAVGVLSSHIYTSTDAGTTWTERSITGIWSAISVAGSGSSIIVSQKSPNTYLYQSIMSIKALTIDSKNIILNTFNTSNGTGNITINGFINSNIVPAVTSQYSLGTSTYSWKDIYVGSNSKVTEAYVTTDATANIQLATQSVLSLTGSSRLILTEISPPPTPIIFTYLRVMVNGTIYKIQMIAE